MKYLFSLLFIMLIPNTQTLFDFKKGANIGDWWIVNDTVMGGRSNSSFRLTTEGHGLFSGTVSLENNGGFSSVRYQFKAINVEAFSKVRVRLKGDGKPYEFRVKSDRRDYYSYIAPFNTTGEWQEVDIALADMYPSFRGRKLNRSNFSSESIEEVVFLIGNKKPESFELLIDKIELQ